MRQRRNADRKEEGETRDTKIARVKRTSSRDKESVQVTDGQTRQGKDRGNTMERQDIGGDGEKVR